MEVSVPAVKLDGSYTFNWFIDKIWFFLLNFSNLESEFKHWVSDFFINIEADEKQR